MQRRFGQLANAVKMQGARVIACCDRALLTLYLEVYVVVEIRWCRGDMTTIFSEICGVAAFSTSYHFNQCAAHTRNYTYEFQGCGVVYGCLFC